MWPEARWIAILLTLAIQTLPAAYAANTQSKRFSATSDIRVVSVTPDTAGNFVLLNTQKYKQLPFPKMRYMPAPDGRAIMTVDFAGATYDPQQSLINFDRSAVRQVRIGQVQSYPPVMRISMLADRADVFNRVDFRSAPGSLAIKLPPAEGIQAYEVAPPVAPPIAPDRAAGGRDSQRSSGPYDTSTPPGNLDRRDETRQRSQRVSSLPSDAVYLPLSEKKKDKKTIVAEAAPTNAEPQPEPQPAPGKLKRFFKKWFGASEEPQEENKVAQDAVPKPAPDVIRKTPPKTAPVPVAAPAARTVRKPEADPRAPTLIPSNKTLKIIASGEKPFAVDLVGSGKFTYRSFRLSNPDRLVIDITGLEQPIVQLDQIRENEFVKNVRVGNPDGNPNITRVVLDLTTPEVADIASAQEAAGCTALHIILQKDENAPREPKQLRAGMTVVLDAGHGGSDPGAQRGDIQEKQLTLEIVEKLRKALLSAGVKVHMTRSDDTFVSLEDRVKITNSVSPDAFVSVHINSLETNTHTTGIETYYQNEASKDLAKFIHNSLVAGLAAPDRGVRKARFYVINHTPVPAILAEVGFISNKEEREKLSSSDYQKQIAAAVADGVILFLSERGGADSTASNSAGSGSASASGTISTTVPSGTGQSLTQNLQTPKAQQIRSNSKRVAATRSW